METKVNVTIDGKEISANPGQTILEVATNNGIFIPTLCHYQNTTNVGTCRVCNKSILDAVYYPAYLKNAMVKISAPRIKRYSTKGRNVFVCK